MLAMTIFAVMSVMILTVYFNVTDASRKLNATRQLSETAREITERIAQDVREKGINLATSKFEDGVVWHDLWRSSDYSGQGGAILGVGTNRRYIYGKKIPSGTSYTLDYCTDADKANPKTLCGLYLVEDHGAGYVWADAYNLVDSFIPEEEKKRVKIEDFRFYISWDESTGKKVMMNFTLSLLPRIGVPAPLVNSTKLHVQTTISERIFKTY